MNHIAMGRLRSSGDGGLATDAHVSAQVVAVNSAGKLFIADGGRVRTVSPDGIISTAAATDGANAVAVDAAGNLLIAGSSNDDSSGYYYIRKVLASGNNTTLAGVAGPCEAAGDGEPAVS